MCRMVVYKGLGIEQSILLSDLIVKPNHSIIRQSYNCQERFHDTGLPPQLNADGFGIGWYAEPMFVKDNMADVKRSNVKKRKRFELKDGNTVVERNVQLETPCTFTSVTPAWNNRNLFQLADKVRSPLIFGHVRAASLGSTTTETNCHPFTFDKFLFMHNGGIADFKMIKRGLVQLIDDRFFDMMQGNTDSEHCFALYLTILSKLQPLHLVCTAQHMLSALEMTIDKINELCRKFKITEASLLNFAITDGAILLASRYVNVDNHAAASLYFSSGSKWGRSIDHPNEHIMQRDDNVEKVFLLASEKLSIEASDWMEVPINHAIIVSKSINVQLYPIRAKSI